MTSKLDGVTSPRLLIVQPDPADPPGALGGWLRDAGAELALCRPPDDRVPATPAGYDAIVCLGGEMGAHDDVAHPWLAEVRRLLAAAVTADVPVMAICLGAQLLAVATGGQVRRIPDGPEVGTLLVAKRDAAAGDPLFADVPFMPDVLQFHDDEICQLPPRATLLAAGNHCANQAFRVGRCGYGLQFHIETTNEMVAAWAEGDSARHARPGDLTIENLTERHRDIAAAWQPVAERFVRLAAGELRAGSEPLPLA